MTHDTEKGTRNMTNVEQAQPTPARLESLGFKEWTMVPTAESAHEGYAIHTNEDSSVPVAHVFRDAPNALAYVRLFAAAPELLEALIALAKAQYDGTI